ncbi:flagellar motor switch protein FliM [Poseidonocella pacifica]|uniref:Flagellar motor switch protein FliM n=2 Tax=Poseidonocella pacifica TaxID=871651 RepID=A0A1I0X8R0_9RHOB|nr:flagellar motor switch protein FliM [Poseidonocella pacifica]
MSAQKAMRLALSKGFDKTISLPAKITAVRQDVLKLEPLLDRLNDSSLLVLLDGPEGAAGAIMLDRPLLSAIVEMQTLGYVPSSSSDRTPTRTDAAIAEPVINDLLKRFAELLLENADEIWPSGYRFGAKVADTRALGLSISEVEYITLDAEVDVFLGTRQGNLILALPKTPLHAEEVPAKRNPEWVRKVSKSVGGAETQLHAVVHRYSLPLSQLARLKPGDVLPIPLESLEDVTLYAGVKPVVSHVRLGQMNGMRALRLGHVPGAKPVATVEPAPSNGELANLSSNAVETASLAAAPMALPDVSVEPEAAAIELDDLPGLEEAEPAAEEDAVADFDFELPEPEPFSLDDLPDPGGAPAGGGDDGIGMPMAVVPINFDDL